MAMKITKSGEIYNDDPAANLSDAYDAYKASQLAAVMAGYQNQSAQLDATAAKLPAYYAGVKNNAAATQAQSKQAWNEYAAGSGLNSGVGGQAELARNNVYGSAIAKADTEQASKLSDIALQRQQLVNALSAQQQQIGADADYKKLTALTDYQQKAKDDERSQFAENVGAYSNDYMAKINNVQNNGDPSDDWKVQILQAARNNKLTALQQAEAEATQQKFENDLALYKAQQSGSSGSKPATPTYGGYTRDEIISLVKADIMTPETAQQLLGLTPTEAETPSLNVSIDEPKTEGGKASKSPFGSTPKTGTATSGKAALFDSMIQNTPTYTARSIEQLLATAQSSGQITDDEFVSLMEKYGLDWSKYAE